MLHKKKRRFLMIENQRDWYETVKEAFKKHRKTDYEIMWVKGSKEALKMLKMNRIDAVILEIILPMHLTENSAKEGIELCKRIRNSWPGLPIIALTIRPSEAAEKEMRAAGATYFITKPSRLILRN